MQDYIIAIDIGTTSAKSISILTNGEILSSHQQFYPTSFSAEGFAEQDPDVVFKAAVALIKKSIISSAHCVGISFSAAMHSLTAIDQSGAVIFPLSIWSDTRSKKQSERIIESGLSQRFYEITGTPVHPMSPLCKLIWLKENRIDIFNNANKFLSIKEYILFQLTNEFVVDHSTASATGLFDIENLKWSDEVVSYIGLKAEQLSRPMSVDSKLYLTKQQTSNLGMNQKTSIIIGASDGCLAQLGNNALGNNDLTITIGTSGAVRVASSSRQIDPQGKVFNYILNDDKFICGGATNSGSVLLDWFKNSMDKNASSDINEFAKQASQIPAGCEGLICIPFQLGERAPVYDPDASGFFWGIKMQHTKLHFQKALLEGICLEIKWILETVENNVGKRSNVFLSGGITRSPIWTQLLCDVLCRKIEVHEGTDASTIGAAMLGFESLKIPFKMSKVQSRSFIPDENSSYLYEKHFRVFKQIYERLKDVKLQ